MQLKDVAVFITGGGSGLGAATARAMAAKGAKVAVFDQHKENAEKVAAEVGIERETQRVRCREPEAHIVEERLVVHGKRRS